MLEAEGLQLMIRHVTMYVAFVWIENSGFAH